MDELSACPFCGAKVAFVGSVAEILCTYSDDPDYDWNDSHYAVVCDCTKGGCGSMTGCDHDTPEEAAAAWNRRPENG